MEEETGQFIQSWWSRAEGRVTGSHVLHLAIPVKLFANSWAREELTHCWEYSTFPIIL